MGYKTARPFDLAAIPVTGMTQGYMPLLIPSCMPMSIITSSADM